VLPPDFVFYQYFHLQTEDTFRGIVFFNKKSESDFSTTCQGQIKKRKILIFSAKNNGKETAIFVSVTPVIRHLLPLHFLLKSVEKSRDADS